MLNRLFFLIFVSLGGGAIAQEDWSSSSLHSTMAEDHERGLILFGGGRCRSDLRTCQQADSSFASLEASTAVSTKFPNVLKSAQDTDFVAFMANARTSLRSAWALGGILRDLRRIDAPTAANAQETVAALQDVATRLNDQTTTGLSNHGAGGGRNLQIQGIVGTIIEILVLIGDGIEAFQEGGVAILIYILEVIIYFLDFAFGRLVRIAVAARFVDGTCYGELTQCKFEQLISETLPALSQFGIAEP